MRLDENGLQIDELTDILAELIAGYREIYGADLQLSQDTPDGQRLFIASEIRELEGLLAAIPKENVIERTSLEARLENAKNVLDTLPQTGEGPKARLTFRGKPVFESHGISADGDVTGADCKTTEGVSLGNHLHPERAELEEMED